MFDCRTCGACCGPTYDQPAYVDLTPHDFVQLSALYKRKTTRLVLHTKRDHNGCVCVALRGTVGVRVSCAIYARRPRACATFRPGSRDCINARRERQIAVNS